jgi:hypothetical protein
MKNTLKVLGFIALAIIGLSLAACDEAGVEENGGGDDNGFIGATLTISNEPVLLRVRDYETYEDVYIPFNGTVEGLNYVYAGDFTTGQSQLLPLNEVFNGTNTVTLKDGKMSVKLGTPKAFTMVSVEYLKTMYPSLTIDPSDAKFYELSSITDSNENNRIQIGSEDNLRNASYWYSDKNVTINGTGVRYNEWDGSTTTFFFAMDLKSGWNSLISSGSQTSWNSYEGTVKNEKLSDKEKWILMSNNNGGSEIAVTGVSLNRDTLSLNVGSSETLIEYFEPSYATNRGVSWSSSNNAVATVSDYGTVTAISVGTATITVTTDDGGFTATCAVTVSIGDITPSNLAAYLATLSENTVSSPHNIALKASSENDFIQIRSALQGAPNKYVNLDLTGSTVTSIRNWGFDNCPSLISIIIPNSVTSIGIAAFQSCENLVSANIPDSVTSIEGFAFNLCHNLTSITIGNGVTSIGEYAFNYCTSLASVILGNNVTSIGLAAFHSTIITSITIPSSVTSIGRAAFELCENLVSVNIGSGSIGDYAFNGCTSLTSVTMGNNVTNIGQAAFNRTGITNITIPNSVTSIGQSAFQSCENLVSVTIGSGSIGDYAFNGCSKLSSVTMVNGVTSIGEYAFQNCTSLASVSIPNSVTSIEEGTFNQCHNLASITIGNGVKSIGLYAFNMCLNLNSVTFLGAIPSSGFHIGAFNNYDLRNKFYETDSTNGTPGTYTRPSGGYSGGGTWTKQ